MANLLLILCIVTVSMQSVFKKQYSIKLDKGILLFNGISALFAMLFFVIAEPKPEFNAGTSVYSAAFAAAYMISLYTWFAALRTGPFAITSLIISYSLIIPTLYGLIWLGEPFTLNIGAGFVLLAWSLYLITEKKKADKAMSLKWLTYLVLAFVSNGMCSVIQKEQQIAFDGAYKCEFMMMALGIVVLIFAACIMINERKIIRECLLQAIIPAALCGIANGVTNYLVMIVTAYIAASVFFPVLSAGNVVFVFVVSVVFFKENFSAKQLAGVAVGIASLVLLNV